MSELKVDKVSPRSGNYVALNTVGMKNIIINGDMSIAQRSTSVAGITGTGYNTVDRWQNLISSLGTWTNSQSTDVPTGQGFATSLKMDCTTADAAPASNDVNLLIQRFEGQNLQYLKKGTANAESLTLSFWVKSNKTGTYTAEIYDGDNTRYIGKTYTISIADTWEKKTLTFAGDTTGALDNDNANSLNVHFWLGAGSDFTGGTFNNGTWGDSGNNTRVSSSQVNLADSTANDWYITGVQLEAGTTASDFEFLPYDMNLQRCMRYYQNSYRREVGGVYPGDGTNSQIDGWYQISWNDGNAGGVVFPVTMRASPTVTLRDRDNATTGKVTQNSIQKDAGVTNTNQNKMSFIGVTSGTASVWTFYRWECDAEL
jgi:hypothetical protein